MLEAAPAWWVMENVTAAPIPEIHGYITRAYEVTDYLVGGLTLRKRRFCFGTPDGRDLRIQLCANPVAYPNPAVLASGTIWCKQDARPASVRSWAEFERLKRLQGLPDDYELPGHTARGAIHAIGNGVPMAMGLAVARR